MTEESRLGWKDALVPAVLLALGAAELATVGTTGWVPSIGLEALAALALVFRRTRPVVAVPCSALALMAIPLTGTQMQDAATPIFFYVLGIYSLGRYLGTRSGLLTMVLTLALVFADFGFDPSDNDWTDFVFVLSLAVPPYLFGRISRKLAEQGELLARQSEQLRDQAVRDERDRIARELHDVIAHSVSAMVVQTAAAQDLVRSHPDRAAEMLESVAEAGREALSETGRLLHLIRDDADELGLRPAPGLADVPGAGRVVPRGWARCRRLGRPAGASRARRGRRLGLPRRAGGAHQCAEVRRRPGAAVRGGRRPRAADLAAPTRSAPAARTAPGWACRGWPSGSACSAGRCGTARRATGSSST